MAHDHAGVCNGVVHDGDIPMSLPFAAALTLVSLGAPLSQSGDYLNRPSALAGTDRGDAGVEADVGRGFEARCREVCAAVRDAFEHATQA